MHESGTYYCIKDNPPEIGLLKPLLKLLTADLISSSRHHAALLPDFHILALQVALGLVDGKEGAVLQLRAGGLAVVEVGQGQCLQIGADEFQVLVGAVSYTNIEPKLQP